MDKHEGHNNTTYTNQLPPPGWYMNPVAQRPMYWDGRQWQPQVSSQSPVQNPSVRNSQQFPTHAVNPQQFQAQSRNQGGFAVPTSKQSGPQQNTASQFPGNTQPTSTSPTIIASKAASLSTSTKKTVLFSVIAAVVVIAVLVVGLAIRTGALNIAGGRHTAATVALTKESAYGDYFDETKWDLQDPEPSLDTAAFTMDLTEAGLKKVCSQYYDAPNKSADNADEERAYTVLDPSKAIEIFVDRNLTYRYPVDAEFYPSREELVLTGQLSIGIEGFDGFWTVEKYDKDGNAYERPHLTYYAGDKDLTYSKDIERPASANVTVDSNGEVNVHWSKVDGVDGYEVEVIGYSPQVTSNYQGDTFGYAIGYVNDANTTSATISQLEKGFQQYQDELRGEDSSDSYDEYTSDTYMNSSLSFLVNQSQDDAEQCANRKDLTLCKTGIRDDHSNGGLRSDESYSDDERKQAYTFDSAADLTEGAIVVRAAKKIDDGYFHYSYGTIVSLDDIKSDIPLARASWRNSQNTQNIIFVSDYTTEDELKTKLTQAAKYYVTMADGTTRMAVVEIDESKSSRTKKQLTVPGTTLSRDLDLEISGTTKYNYDDLSKQFEQTIADLKKSQPKGGALRSTITVGNTEIDADAFKAMKTDSQPIGKNGVEKYKPFGSTDYTKYVAENMLAMHQKIDITDYASTKAAPELQEVLNEVYTQNPYLLAQTHTDRDYIAAGQYVDENRVYLVVQYPDGMKENMEAMQKKASEVASQINAQGADGVRAIEQYLAVNGEYDSDAVNAHENNADNPDYLKDYPHAWSDGILLHGKGVCMSYAIAFDAIADQLGIESYYVSGRSYDYEGRSDDHAWNRVRIDNTWYDVDPTWDDDGDAAGTEYSLAKANEMKLHKVDATWMLKSNINKYGGYTLDGLAD